MAKVPTRSPTHEGVDVGRLAPMGLELEDIATDEVVDLDDLAELAEDRGRPASHYLAALALATDLKIKPAHVGLSIQVCVGTCQQYGALAVLDHLMTRRDRFSLAVVSCLDSCDQAPVCRLAGRAGDVTVTASPFDFADLDSLIDQPS